MDAGSSIYISVKLCELFAAKPSNPWTIASPLSCHSVLSAISSGEQFLVQAKTSLRVVYLFSLDQKKVAYVANNTLTRTNGELLLWVHLSFLWCPKAFSEDKKKMGWSTN